MNCITIRIDSRALTQQKVELDEVLVPQVTTIIGLDDMTSEMVDHSEEVTLP